MNIVYPYPYLKGSVEESINYQNCIPSINVTKSSGVPWMVNSSYDTFVSWRCPPRTLYTNTVGLPPVPLTPPLLTVAKTGYVQPFFYIQNKVNKAILTSFFPAPDYWNQDFQPVPYNSSIYVSKHVHSYVPLDHQRHDRVLVHTVSPGCSWSKDNQGMHQGIWFARNIIPYQQKLLRPQLQLLRLNCESQDQDIGIEFSEKKVIRARQKRYGKAILPLEPKSQFVETDKLSVMMRPVHKSEDDEICISGDGVNNSPKSFTSEGEDCGWTDKHTSKDKSIKHTPNPNGRGRSASVISEASTTLSFDTIESDIAKDPMFSTPSQQAVSDERIGSSIFSSPTSQQAVCDVLSDLDFVINPQSSSEFNCEFRESSIPRPLKKGLTTPVFLSKPTVLKPLPFIIDPPVQEDQWHIVSHRKKRKYIKALPVKPRKPSPHIFSELALSHEFLEIPKKCRKRKKKRKLKLSEQKKLRTIVVKNEDKLKDSSEILGTTRKYRKSSCSILREYIFRLILWWSMKRS